MPPSITNFKSTQTTCSFKMENMPKINLEITERTHKISLNAKDSQILSLTVSYLKMKINVKLTLKLMLLNFMMKMMVENL